MKRSEFKEKLEGLRRIIQRISDTADANELDRTVIALLEVQWDARDILAWFQREGRRFEEEE